MNRSTFEVATRVFVSCAAAIAASALPSCTDVGRCRLGTENCLCDENACESIALRCNADDVCESCPLGAQGCACAAGDVCSGAALRCNNNRICESCPEGNAGCACMGSGTCNGGFSCLDGTCVDPSTVYCADTCYSDWNDDGTCDDGGPGSSFSVCTLGTDCTDCGVRAYPCTNPAYPVYCPETSGATNADNCWSPDTDCDTVVYCTRPPGTRARPGTVSTAEPPSA